MSSKKRSKGFFIVSLCLFLYSLMVLLACVFSMRFAELYSVSISRYLRFIFTKVFGILPFSVGEVLIFLALLSLVGVIIAFVVMYIKRSKRKASVRFVFYGSIMLLFSVFVNLFGVCYFRNPLEKNMRITRKEMSRELLYKATSYIAHELDESIADIELTEKSTAKNPYTFDEINGLIDKGYEKMYAEYDFFDNTSSHAKPLIVSPIMTYTHISGFYLPFTSEANVNTNYPDIVVAYSMAHEKAHQRGIAGEDDANFVAFLSLMYTGDAYIKYCALYNMYEYFLDALYQYDLEMFYYFLEQNNPVVNAEMIEYRDFFTPYRNSSASKVADAVNDTYIKAMGNSDGTESYGKVVELFASWFE